MSTPIETDQAAREASGAHPYGRYLEEFEVGAVYKHWPAKRRIAASTRPAGRRRARPATTAPASASSRISGVGLGPAAVVAADAGAAMISVKAGMARATRRRSM